MTLAKVVSKPAPTPVAKSDPVPVPAQDASAFSAKLKKANADQQGKNARQKRDELRATAAEDASAARSVIREGDELAIRAASQRQQQGGDDESGQSLARIATQDLAGDVDASFLVDQLAPLTANDGMFEVLIPSGAKLSIALKASANRVQILIGSDSASLGDQLKRKKMELEQRLGRRIGKDVVLAVL
ncbi:hypothetical protein [Actimicrobium antarcticum]|uniref:Flagellar hook-length control protein-like C-terminal domain-containing protein n=1 Tax=Actimicrobium antarcticum TaxID=1051899 RepID=A0ABP7SUH0_9BURK